MKLTISVGRSGCVLIGLLLTCGAATAADEQPDSVSFDRPVTTLSFDPMGKQLALACGDGKVCLWSIIEKKVVRELKAPSGTLTEMSYRADGEFLVAAAVNEKCVWYWPIKDDVGRKYGQWKSSCLSVTFSQDGRNCAAGYSDGVIWLFHCADDLRGNQAGPLIGHTGFINSLVFSPDGKLLASCGRGPDLKLWDTKTWKLVADLETHENHVTAVVFSPDGKTLYSSSLDGTVKLWEVATRKEKATLKGPKDCRLTCLALSPDGKTLTAAGNFKTICLWDTVTLKSLPSLEGHTENVLALAFTPDGKSLASSSQDRTIRFWKIVDQ
jgi:WD40 repeat protein